ncbi:hypothetical protein HPB47_010704 [Ixodes persulcatus]|uniref:Uncharacterized protein n=1 Tax=Ixodes persulcatus TaxID=34615 RepID=A0AC60NYE2_IXOPE|nr:hypothetical protein HPB47_010704 [Ixodes persulcatus]
MEGEDISPEEFQCAGWQSAFTKRKSSQKCLPTESEQPANMPSGSSNGGPALPPACKGIIRNIDLEFDHEQLKSLIVQPRNPKALEARRLKNSTTVVILFDGLKVSNYVMCGLSMPRCTLYQRQTEGCYAWGRLGHRADVCPTPENVVCRGCGVNSSSDQQVCSPKCALCGGPHPTDDKSCKQRYQVPYIVRQRKKERRDYNQDFPPMGTLSRPAVPPRAGSESRGPGKTRVPSRGRSRPAAKETGWDDRVKGSPTEVTGGTPPEEHNARIVHGAIEKLRAELAEVRSARKCEASQSPQAPKPAREETPIEARTAKKRALTKPVRDERLEEFQTEMRVKLKSLSEAVAMLNAKVDVLDGKFNALEARLGILEQGRKLALQNPGILGSIPTPARFDLDEHRTGVRSCITTAFALIVAGDFNAPLRAWGYSRATRKGADLWQAAATHDLTLATDPADTTPDLTFVKNVGAVSWHNLNEDLGSDHNILATCINFRKSREEWALIQDSSIDMERWATQLKGDVKSATKTVQMNLEIDRLDSRLAHLLEAKKALLDRLRKKIAELDRTIEDHCQSFTRQQWDEVCNSVDGQMRSQVISIVLHEARQSETEDAILDALINKYLPIGTSSPADYPSYKRPPCLELNEPSTYNEVRKVLQNLNGRSAPGPNGISNRALRTLEDGSIEFLTDEINHIWEQGSVPESWKTVTVVLIPKPGWPPGLDSLRPISLTSCVGKVAEHVLHNSISRHIEGKNLFPYNMIGFSPSLSTQDAMKLLKHQIFNKNTRDVRAILGLDLEKAFGSITHAHILDSISELGPGHTFHKFVSSFLRSRKATLKIGDLKSDAMELGPKGTPQGSVISPLLFSVALCKLSKQLFIVEGINHTLYADNITIWCVGGSEGEVETALQEALDQTEHFLTNTGLKCTSSKSELLLYRPVRRGPKPKGWMPLSEVDITIRTSTGNPIPRVNVLRVFGMLIERECLREDNLLRLFHAFLMSHITYVAAIYCWHGHEKEKVDTPIRKSIKRPIPMQASTSDSCSYRFTIPWKRSSRHRKLPRWLGCRLRRAEGRFWPYSASTPRSLRSGDISFLTPKGPAFRPPFLRNVHPQYNVGRRRARAIALLRHVRDEPRLGCFVDAAQYGRSARFAAVAIDHKGSILNSASFKDSTPSRAERRP